MTFGHECPNCGMLPFACVCVPWCGRHDRAEPCADCERVRDEATEGGDGDGAPDRWLSALAVAAALVAVPALIYLLTR